MNEENLNPIQQAMIEKTTKLGSDIRAVVEFGGGQIIHLSRKKYAFLHAFAETGSFQYAVKKADVKSETAKGWLKDPNVQSFIRDCTQWAAKVNGYTYKKWLGNMIDIYEGRKEASAQQVKAGELLGKTLNYAPKDIQVVNKIENASIRFDFTGKNQNILDSDQAAPGSIEDPGASA